jgi:hypothetical protein
MRSPKSIAGPAETSNFRPRRIIWHRLERAKPSLVQSSPLLAIFLIPNVRSLRALCQFIQFIQLIDPLTSSALQHRLQQDNAKLSDTQPHFRPSLSIFRLSRSNSNTATHSCVVFLPSRIVKSPVVNNIPSAFYTAKPRKTYIKDRRPVYKS